MGTSPQDLEKLIKARSGFAKTLKDAKNPLIIMGAGAFQREDGEAVHALGFEAAEKFGAGFNVLHRAASRVGALDIGFIPQAGGKAFADILAGTKDGSIKALYLLGADEFDARSHIGWKTFVIYQGHHGDHGAARADVIFPAAAYTEKDALYVNTEGRPQMARRAVFPPGEAREDWKILRALSEFMKAKLPYDTLEQLRGRIFEDYKHLAEIDQINPAKWGAFGEKGKVSKEPFASPVKNYYLVNSICRASDTMRACSQQFVKPDVKQLEAAE